MAGTLHGSCWAGSSFYSIQVYLRLDVLMHIFGELYCGIPSRDLHFTGGLADMSVPVPVGIRHAHVDHIMATVKREMACAFPKKDVVMGLLDAAVRLSRSAEWACQVRNLSCVFLEDLRAHVACQ